MVKNLPGNAGDADSNPGLEKSPGVGNGNPLPYSCWEIPCTEEPGGLQFVGLQSHTSQCLNNNNSNNGENDTKG